MESSERAADKVAGASSSRPRTREQDAPATFGQAAEIRNVAKALRDFVPEHRSHAEAAKTSRQFDLYERIPEGIPLLDWQISGEKP